MTEIKFVLDFDGVLFNSAFEAYSVCNETVAGKEGCRQDVSYEEFLSFRSVVTDAWQYNRLYSSKRSVPVSAVATIKPDAEDWQFSHDFFEARERIMADPDWPKLMPPYDFFYLVKPYLIEYPQHFAILSTRNVKSLHETLAFHDADVVQIFGQEDIRRLGSKLNVAKSEHWLDRGRYLIVYVDDMNRHLEPFEGEIHLPLHANWGYDASTSSSLSANQIHTIITSLLTIAKRT